MTLPVRQSDPPAYLSYGKWRLYKDRDWQLWAIQWPNRSGTVFMCPTWETGMKHILSIIKRDYR